MAKGLFTQGICVLLEHTIDVKQIESALSGFEIVGRHPASGNDDATDTLVLKYRPDAGGHVLVTLAPQPWPDDMGDPEESAELFVAWSLGQFGPLAFPGCLARACDQSWGWKEGAELAKRHQAHIRILISYVIDQDEEVLIDHATDPDDAQAADRDAGMLSLTEGDSLDDDEDVQLLPDEYDAVAELQFLMRVISPLMELPGVLCYFNPGGEVLRDANGLRQGLNEAWLKDIPPLDMWTNVRLYQAAENWSLMDTVGNGQFDLPDMEAVFVTDSFEPHVIEEYLRALAYFSLREDNDFEDGDTAEGPGGMIWTALECDEGLTDPPRPTIRWIPETEDELPDELLATGIEDDESELDGDELDQFMEDEIQRLLGGSEPDDSDFDDDQENDGTGGDELLPDGPTSEDPPRQS